MTDTKKQPIDEMYISTKFDEQLTKRIRAFKSRFRLRYDVETFKLMVVMASDQILTPEDKEKWGIIDAKQE